MHIVIIITVNLGLIAFCKLKLFKLSASSCFFLFVALFRKDIMPS